MQLVTFLAPIGRGGPARKARFAEPMRKSRQAGRALVCRQDRTATMGKSDVPVFVAVRNDAARLPFFLNYHRRLGIGHFLVVDTGSSDGVEDLVCEQPDCSLWRLEGLQDDRAPQHALNHLLRTHGSGRWCLTLEPNELFAFPYCEHRRVQDLIDFLGSEAREQFFYVQVDMYGR